MNISFYGAAGEVTGSCYLIESNGHSILVDCGLFQGSQLAAEQNHTPFVFSPKSIEAVLITHAHLDHTGRIPKLVHDGFTGKIMATAPTLELAKLIWDDASEIMEYEQKKTDTLPIYSAEDVLRAKTLTQAQTYRHRTEILPGIVATWHDAGHILGSSFIEIEAEGKTIIFSGDLGNGEVPILQATETRPNADVLVMESTYGAHLHEGREQRVQELRQTIINTIKNRGVLLVPAFAIERIQEIIYELNSLVEKNHIPPVPIYVDSPLAIKATAVFKRFPEYYNAKAMQLISSGDDFFNFPRLFLTATRDESRTINDAHAPKVIIAGSGMMTGGRIMHHLQRYLSLSTTTVLIVGYQAVHTLGRQLLEGAKNVRIHGQTISVRAQIKKIGGYSSHADQSHLISWATQSPKKPKTIFLVHGETDSHQALRPLLQPLGARIEVPRLGSSYEL